MIFCLVSQKARNPNQSLPRFSRNRTALNCLISTCSPTSLRLDKLIRVCPLAPSMLSIRSASIPSKGTDRSDPKCSVDFFVTMSSPAPTDGNLVEHRRDTRVILEIEIRSRSIGANIPWDSIRIPHTKSVKSSATGHKKTLDFRLEVQGATTGTLLNSLCRPCTEREPRNSLVPRTIVDFTSKTDIIDLKNGKAEVTFRFLCLSTHHGSADSEYR